MSSGSYFPPVKAVPIPKKSGGVRLLGIPTVADRIAQTAVKLWLEPQLDPMFRDDSYGYRPGNRRWRQSLLAEEMETEPSKPIDKTSRGEVTSHRAVTTVNALWPRK